MLKFLCLCLLLILQGCSSTSEEETYPLGLKLTEDRPDRLTALTKQNIIHLAQVYDVSSLLYFKSIKISSSQKTGSFPLIVIDTKYATEPLKLFSVWLHEEFHWWAQMNKAQLSGLHREIYKLIGRPKTNTEKGLADHLIICFLEYRSLQHFLGRRKANQILASFIRQGRYAWLFKSVLQHQKSIESLLKRRNLLPKVLA